MTMKRFNALLEPEQDDILHYLSTEYKQGRCEALRSLIDTSTKVAVIQRRLKDDAAFRREFAKQVLRSKQQ